MITAESVVVHDRVRAGAPTIMLIVGAAPFEKLLEYFREKGLSLSAERTYAQAVGRFVEWLSVRATEFHATADRGQLYTAFVHDVQNGTYRNGQDEYGLGWTATSHNNLHRLTTALLEFTDWLSERYGTTMLNPIHNVASHADQLIFWRKWNKQKAGSLMAHAKSRRRAAKEASIGRRASLPRKKNCTMQEAKDFPAEHLDALIWKGFINPGKATDSRPWVKYKLRDLLICLLCVYGGCRPSEPLHLWVGDVLVDPDDSEKALVLIHEPHEGTFEYVDPFTGRRRRTSRADYLQRFCAGRKPLTLETGRRHAGWKGCLLTHREEKAYQVFWIDKDAGRLFLTFWRLYVKYVRPVTPQMPWAFLTKDGQPLGVKGYDDSFQTAVRRIGLRPAKWAGTTSHGPRHRYGQWLNELGLGDKEGQVAMHHINAKSQEVYRQLGVASVASAVSQLEVITIPELTYTE